MCAVVCLDDIGSDYSSSDDSLSREPSFTKQWKNRFVVLLYFVSVYSPFFDRVGLPLHNI